MDRKITKIPIEEARELIDDSCPFCATNLNEAIESGKNHVWLWGTDIYVTRAQARACLPKKKLHMIFED